MRFSRRNTFHRIVLQYGQTRKLSHMGEMSNGTSLITTRASLPTLGIFINSGDPKVSRISSVSLGVEQAATASLDSLAVQSPYSTPFRT